MVAPLTIIAGQGHFPRQLAETVSSNGRPVAIAALNGFCATDWPIAYQHRWFDLGQAQSLLDYLSELGCSEIAMAGAVKRPRLSHLKVDKTAASFLANTALKALGDNSLLEAINGAFAQRGITVIGVEALARDLLTPPGCLATILPSSSQFRQAATGFTAAKAIGALDIGQAVVVFDNRVVAVEGTEGTAELIARSGRFAGQPGAILVKAAKPGQLRTLDLPSFGAETVDQLIASGFAGAFIETGASLFLERDRAIAKANAFGLFIYGMGGASLG